MLSKAVAILALVILPMSAVLWHKSHDAPRQYRFDITLYKSLRVYLKDGACGLRLLSLPTKTASRSEFHASLDYNARQMRKAFALSSMKRGSYRITWLVFPLWFPTVVLAFTGTVPIFVGPVRRWWREWKGHCLECGYNLYGNRSGRCPECGTRFRPGRRRASRSARRPVRTQRSLAHLR